MKILMVNKFYYIKGGSETYYFSLKRELENQGHTVIDFSMKDEKNFRSPYERYFVDNVDYSRKVSAYAKMKMAFNIIYSKEAKEKFEELVKKECPDLIHLHIFQHQISPSILDICKKYNIPTVYTAHDLKMICLNYKMMHHGKICEKCRDGHLYHCVLNKCVKDSFLKSSINMMEGYIHKWKKSYDAIDYIITPSNFYRNKFLEFGIAPERVIHIANFLERQEPQIEQCLDSETYYLYFGRLSEEKGILTLLKAMEKNELKLYIVGSGPLEEQIEKCILKKQMTNVKMLGFKSGKELINLVGNAKAVILPSEWYENGPYSAIEALQVGVPIIGADIGGIPELIDENGYLFEHGNVKALNCALEKMENLTREEYILLKNKSKQLYRKNYTSNVHLEALMKIYIKALEKRGKL